MLGFLSMNLFNPVAVWISSGGGGGSHPTYYILGF